MLNPPIKYLVYGGDVVSTHDYQTHYISPEVVARLYDVPHPHCKFVPAADEKYWQRRLRKDTEWRKRIVILAPRSDGDYDLNKRIKEQNK